MAEARATVGASPKKRKANYRPLYYVLAVLLAMSVLASPISTFTHPGVTFVDLETHGPVTAARRYVETSSVLSGPEGLAEMPTHIGRWSETREYGWDNVAKILNADMILARDYRAPRSFRPISLVIVDSTNASSFHPARVCYVAQKYTLLDEFSGLVEIPITNKTLLSENWPGGGRVDSDVPTMQAKRLVAERDLPGGGKERVLNLYFYIRQESDHVTNHLTWVRVSRYIAPGANFSADEDEMKAFMGEVLPRILTFSADQSGDTVAEWTWHHLVAAVSRRAPAA